MVHTRASGGIRWIEYRPEARSLSDQFEVSWPVAMVVHHDEQALVAYDGQTKMLPKWMQVLVNP